ncbi:MAG: voltage-gated potassium channel [Bacteroidia bacterium]|jgi:voltage-gated potassium channel
MSDNSKNHISIELKKRIVEDRQGSHIFKKKYLKWIIEEVIFGTETRWGKGFDVILLYAILASVAIVLLESVKEIRGTYQQSFYIAEWVFTILFSLEYLMRLWVANKSKDYALSFFGIIDLLSIIPTYLSLILVGSQYLLILRIFRLLRVFRILKLVRYLRSAQVLVDSMKASKEKIVIFLGAVVILATMLGTIMYMIEGGENGFNSIPRSIYWAIVTLTTVGYGDISPATALGQFVAAIVMILGYSIIAVPTGIIGAEMAMSAKKRMTICSRCSQTDHLEEANHCHECGCELEHHEV